jgi:aminopeptidase N
VRVAAPGSAKTWLGLVSAPRPRRVAVAGGPAIVNFGQTGNFRTRYEPELWSRLTLAYPSLASADQLGLLYDSRALGESGAIPMGDFLALARTAAQVQEPVVLTALANELAALARVYPPDKGEAYRAYARARLSPILARIGWEPRPGEGDNVPALRDALVRTLSDLDDPQVRAEALRRFTASVQQPGSLTGALARTVQAAAARHADAAAWEQLHQAARTAGASSERARFYRLLGVAKDPALADRALALALSGEPSPTTAPAIIAAVAALHPDKAFDFALAHRAQVELLLEPTSRATFFVKLARGSRDKDMLQKLDAFADTIPDASRGEVRKAEAEIRNRRDFADRGLAEIDRWVAANPE